MRTPELEVRTISAQRAIVRASWIDERKSTGALISPLGQTLVVDLEPTDDGWVSIKFPELFDADFPQFDASHGSAWAVWPVWRLVPFQPDAAPPTQIRLCGKAVPPSLVDVDLDLQGDDGCLWLGSKLDRELWNHDAVSVELESSPGILFARSLAEGALGVLQSWLGQLPWREVHFLIERQQPDLGKEKGVAVNRGASVWCRALLRPDASSASAVSAPGEAVELLVHELLHHILEAETPAGHLLTEGLITYLSRRLAVQGGWLAPDFLETAAQQSISELASESKRHLTLTEAAGQFFADPSARRVAYRKGFLAMAEIDAATGFRLDQLCLTFAGRAGEGRGTKQGGQFSEAEFLDLLPESAKQTYANWIALSDVTTAPLHPTKRR